MIWWRRRESNRRPTTTDKDLRSIEHKLIQFIFGYYHNPTTESNEEISPKPILFSFVGRWFASHVISIIYSIISIG